MSPTACKQLDEINLIRPLVILLIVILHCFTMYSGGWPMPDGIERNYIYMGIAKLSISCTLEAFTFISGYLLAFSQLERMKKSTFVQLISKKTHRLIVPSIIFSFLYLSLIDQKTPTFSLNYLYTIVNGVAHMWYLPMLFWCFIFSHFLLKLKVSNKGRLAIAGILCLIPFNHLPFQLHQTFYYLFYFFLGYYIRSSHETFSTKATRKNILIGALLFGLTFSIFTICNELHIKASTMGASNIATSFGLRIIRMLFATIGIYTLYLGAVSFTKRHTLSPRYASLNKYCFGIYLTHHFILPILYYHSALPAISGSWLLPWIALAITLPLSWAICVSLQHTRIGKYLLG